MLTILLFVTGLFAGTVDAIAGGGGLISLPILLGIGMPPHLALGTSKLQGTIGTFVAARRYYRLGFISLKSIYPGIISGFIGSAAGAIMSQMLDGHLLKKIVPVVLALILVYTIYTPKLGKEDIHPRMNAFLFYVLFGFGLGFYDGFLGPGTGSFWVFGLAFLLGFNLIKATAYTKMFNLNSSFVALVCFAIGGNIDYRAGLIMAAGQLIGARLGASLAINKGANLIRPMFLCVVTCTIASLIYRGYFNIDHTLQSKLPIIAIVASVCLLGSLKLYRRFR